MKQIIKVGITEKRQQEMDITKKKGMKEYDYTQKKN